MAGENIDTWTEVWQVILDDRRKIAIVDRKQTPSCDLWYPARQLSLTSRCYSKSRIKCSVQQCNRECTLVIAKRIYIARVKHVKSKRRNTKV